MSVSTRTNATQYVIGSYSETAIPTCRTRRHHIPRLYPVLENDVNGSALAAANCPSLGCHTPQKDGGRRVSLGDPRRGAKVEEFVVKWKGLSADQVKQNLAPFILHYKLQILLLEERRTRQVILSEEFTRSVEIRIRQRSTAPFREKLLSWNMLDNISQRLQAMRERSLHSSRPLSMSSTYCQQSPTTDPRHTPPPRGSLHDSTPPDGDSASTRTVPRNTLGPPIHPAGGRTWEGHADDDRTATESPRRPCQTPESSDGATVYTIPTVSRRLAASEESDSCSKKKCTPKKKHDDGDSLEASLRRDSLESSYSDDDSLANSIAAVKALWHDDDDDDDDDSLARSLVATTKKQCSSVSHEEGNDA